MHSTRFRITISLLSLFGLLAPGALLLGGCAAEEEPEEPEARPAKMMELSAPLETVTYRFSARAAAARRSVLAFRVPGEVQTVSVELGDAVSTGQELARLDDEDYRYKVGEVSNKLAAAEAAVAEAESHYRRGEELYAAEAISSTEFDSLESAYRQAVATRDGAREGLNQAESALRDTVLEAPFDGVIAARQVDPHENVAPEIPAFILDDPAEIDITVAVSERFVAHRDQIERVEVRLEALEDEAYPAEVVSIGTDVDPVTQAYPVRVRIENPDMRVLPGMTAEVTFEKRARAPADPARAEDAELHGPPRHSYLVPVTALFEEDGTAFVWRWDPESRTVERCEVRTEGLEKDEVRIRNGLRPGDLIVIAGAEYLHDGARVEPHNDVAQRDAAQRATAPRETEEHDADR